MEKIKKTDAEWRAQLSPEEYRILREHGTERAGTGPYLHSKEKGTYACRACDLPLFESDTKYESGSGWPSFFAAVNKENIEEREDSTHGMRRIEILCARCGSHLGHVFPDGPKPTGLRYCTNGASLKLEKKA
jgi:peptide-methionine (R)-S-oxide reductase